MAAHSVADRVCLGSYGAAGTNRLRSFRPQLPLTMMPRTHHSKAQYHKKFFRSEDEHGLRPSLSLCNTRTSVVDTLNLVLSLRSTHLLASQGVRMVER